MNKLQAGAKMRTAFSKMKYRVAIRHAKSLVLVLPGLLVRTHLYLELKTRISFHPCPLAIF